MDRLKSIRIKGYRSIKDELMAGRLQQHLGVTGRATANLHFGPKVTPQLEATIEFEVEKGIDTYQMRLFHAAGDTLIFAEENLSFHQLGTSAAKVVPLGAAHQESRIGDKAVEGDPTAKALRYLLNHCRVYHFHDTSSTARVRQYCYVGDNRWLMPDAANLAAVVFRLQSENETVYRRMVATITQVAPFFADFDLEPTGKNNNDIILNWRHCRSDLVFGPHQLSDGTLRVICMIALLLQPSSDLPLLVVVDEPELGLHPFALNVIASLFQEASRHTQVLVSTQSSTLLDNFRPEDIVVVERESEATKFARHDAEKLATWLDDVDNFDLGSQVSADLDKKFGSCSTLTFVAPDLATDGWDTADAIVDFFPVFA